MISTNICLNDKAKKLLIKAAAIKGRSIESLASEIINEAIQGQYGILSDDFVAVPKRKPALAGTEPFDFLATPEESGIPVEEWEMENDYS
jgi:hypothetical protein